MASSVDDACGWRRWNKGSSASSADVRRWHFAAAEEEVSLLK
jgi:hypothetical protein